VADNYSFHSVTGKRVMKYFAADTACEILSGHVDLMIHVCAMKGNRERSEDLAIVLFWAST